MDSQNFRFGVKQSDQNCISTSVAVDDDASEVSSYRADANVRECTLCILYVYIYIHMYMCAWWMRVYDYTTSNGTYWAIPSWLSIIHECCFFYVMARIRHLGTHTRTPTHSSSSFTQIHLRCVYTSMVSLVGVVEVFSVAFICNIFNIKLLLESF